MCVLITKFWLAFCLLLQAVAAAAVAVAESEAVPDAQKQRVDLTLTEIVDGARFFAHVASDDTLTRLQVSVNRIMTAVNLPPLGINPLE